MIHSEWKKWFSQEKTTTVKQKISLILSFLLNTACGETHTTAVMFTAFCYYSAGMLAAHSPSHRGVSLYLYDNTGLPVLHQSLSSSSWRSVLGSFAGSCVISRPNRGWDDLKRCRSHSGPAGFLSALLLCSSPRTRKATRKANIVCLSKTEHSLEQEGRGLAKLCNSAIWRYLPNPCCSQALPVVRRLGLLPRRRVTPVSPAVCVFCTALNNC